jgi:long-chain acyl-CoA synthetase
MLNLATLLEGSAAQSPDRTALVAGERKLSYRQLNEEANRLARALVRAGVAPRDRVALTMPNVPEFAVAYYGILKAGASVVPLNVLLKAPEISYYLKDSGARIAIAASTFADEVLGGRAEAKGCDEVWVAGGDPRAGSAAGVRALAEVVAGEETVLDSATTMPDDTAVILYTSGTTGKPKGAELSHFNMFFNALYVTERLFRLSPDAVLLAVLLATSSGDPYPSLRQARRGVLARAARRAVRPRSSRMRRLSAGEFKGSGRAPLCGPRRQANARKGFWRAD